MIGNSNGFTKITPSQHMIGAPVSPGSSIIDNLTDSSREHWSSVVIDGTSIDSSPPPNNIMHLNSATTIRVPTKGGSPDADGDGNTSLMMNTNLDHSGNNNSNIGRGIRPRNWSFGSTFDLLDNDNNHIRRNISNGSLDIFSSLRELTPGSSVSSKTVLNSLGIQVGGGGDYDYNDLMGNNGLGIGMGGTATTGGTRPGSAGGLHHDTLYEPELRGGRDAGGVGQGNRASLAMKTSEAASALRRIEMEEQLLQQQPYLDMEDQRHQRMKEILHLQQQQHQILNNESRKTMLNDQGRYSAPVVQTRSPHPQQLQLSQQMLMQEQLRYQHQRQNQSLTLAPTRWSSSQNKRLTDFTTEELFQEVSRRRGETSSVSNSGDGFGDRGRGRRADGGLYLPSEIEQRNDNALLHGVVDRCRQFLKPASDRVSNSIESLRPSLDGDRVGGIRDLVMAPSSKTSSKINDEATNASIVSSQTHGIIGTDDNTNDGTQDISSMKRLRTRNSSFDTLLSVFGDELAELDREESRLDPKGEARGVASYPSSVGTITLDDLMDRSSSGDDEGTIGNETVSPNTKNVQILDTNLPPRRKSSRTIEVSPSATSATMDALTMDSIVRERALFQMQQDMREHLARVAGYGRGSDCMGGAVGGGLSSIPSSLSSTNTYLSELQGLVLPPPPLSHSAMALFRNPLPPPPPPPEKIDPKVALQEFLDKYGKSAQSSRTDLLNAISETEKSLVTIHDWDRSQGLRKCHSRTVVKTRRSRAKIKAFLLGVDPPKELVKKAKRKAET